MIRRLVRELRRAPVRILASVLALALAVGAIGVFAIPTVSTSSLRDAAERDGVPDVILLTTDTGSTDVISTLEAVPDVERVERQIVDVIAFSPAAGGETETIDVVGLELGTQTMDVVRLEAGRMPSAAGELLVTPGTAPIGASFTVTADDGGSRAAEVVGHAQTSFWNESGLAFADRETVSSFSGVEGANRLVIRAASNDGDTLGAISIAARDALLADGITLSELPVEIEGGEHPIEADIEQISMLIGLLGIVAGLVGLVLLASTTNTLIVERSREVAVMRALGATDRVVRRRLRRIALTIAVAATVLGIPIGIAISYTIARMVLDEFVGLTPGFAVSWPVIGASAAFAVIGARLVAARSARRVTKRPLAETLRDRDAVPFGRRWSERRAAAWQRGRLTERLAIRNGLRSRGRSIAISLQLGSAVAALMVVASMATTITDFNDAELEHVRWGSMSWVAGPGLDIDADVADGDDRSETAVEVEGEVLGWQVDVYGWERSTQMIDRTMAAGTWLAEPGDAVVSEGFATRVGVDVGDVVVVQLASGPATYEVVGLHPNRGREVYVERLELATQLGGPDLANRVFSLDAVPDVELTGVVGSERFDELDDDDSGRQAILVIFGAIGVVVVSVAGLAVMSGLAVNLHERRHELAAMRAMGARRRDLFATLSVEIAMLAALGVAGGLVAGFFGGRAIARSFEASNAVEIGFTFADRAIPAVIGAVVVLTSLITMLMVRRVLRQPAAETLRGAA